MLMVLVFGLLGANTNQSLTGNITEPVQQASSSIYPVVKVVDGDTIDVDMNGSKERIRLIGIDAPESVAPNQPVECFGKEASMHLNELLTNKSVKLESDSTQADRDRYGRLLRYVFLDGIDVNKQLLQYGFAREYTYNNKTYQHQQEFRQAEHEAAIAKLGLWQENICSF